MRPATLLPPAHTVAPWHQAPAQDGRCTGQGTTPRATASHGSVQSPGGRTRPALAGSSTGTCHGRSGLSVAACCFPQARGTARQEAPGVSSSPCQGRPLPMSPSSPLPRVVTCCRAPQCRARVEGAKPPRCGQQGRARSARRCAFLGRSSCRAGVQEPKAISHAASRSGLAQDTSPTQRACASTKPSARLAQGAGTLQAAPAQPAGRVAGQCQARPALRWHRGCSAPPRSAGGCTRVPGATRTPCTHHRQSRCSHVPAHPGRPTHRAGRARASESRQGPISDSAHREPSPAPPLRAAKCLSSAPARPPRNLGRRGRQQGHRVPCRQAGVGPETSPPFSTRPQCHQCSCHRLLPMTGLAPSPAPGPTQGWRAGDTAPLLLMSPAPMPWAEPQSARARLGPGMVTARGRPARTGGEPPPRGSEPAGRAQD